MSKRFAARLAATLMAVSTFILVGTSPAMANVDPGLGEGSGTPPTSHGPATTPPFEVFGMAWQAALAIAIALIAVGGLLYSVQHRRHTAGQHA